MNRPALNFGLKKWENRMFVPKSQLSFGTNTDGLKRFGALKNPGGHYNGLWTLRRTVVIFRQCQKPWKQVKSSLVPPIQVRSERAWPIQKILPKNKNWVMPC